MIRISLALLFFVACGGPATATSTIEPEPEPGNLVSDWVPSPDGVAQSFRNDEGTGLVLVPLQSSSDPTLTGRYYLRVTGTQSAYDGLVLLVRREVDQETFVWIAHIRGQDYSILVHEEGAKSWHFKGYDFADANVLVTLVGEPVDVERIVKLRQEQEGSQLRALVPTERGAQELAQSAMLTAESTLGGFCENIPVSIDWSTVKDSWFVEFSIKNECLASVSALQEICQHFPQAAESIGGMELNCSFQGEPKSASYALAHKDGRYLKYSPGQPDLPVWELWSDLISILGQDKLVLQLGDGHLIGIYEGERFTLYNEVGGKYYPAGASSGAHANFSLALPRGARSAAIERHQGKWNLDCGDSGRELKVLAGAEREAVLKKAEFATEKMWKREPYFLSRDSHGTYYYVDRYKHEFGGKRYRVFVGRKGQLKLSKLKGLVEDSVGTLFSTEDGQLRLIISSGSQRGIWIRKSKETPLTSVSTKHNMKLIFDELGVYYGEELGLVCD